MIKIHDNQNNKSDKNLKNSQDKNLKNKQQHKKEQAQKHEQEQKVKKIIDKYNKYDNKYFKHIRNQIHFGKMELMTSKVEIQFEQHEKLYQDTIKNAKQNNQKDQTGTVNQKVRANEKQMEYFHNLVKNAKSI